MKQKQNEEKRQAAVRKASNAIYESVAKNAKSVQSAQVIIQIVTQMISQMSDKARDKMKVSSLDESIIKRDEDTVQYTDVLDILQEEDVDIALASLQYILESMREALEIELSDKEFSKLKLRFRDEETLKESGIEQDS